MLTNDKPTVAVLAEPTRLAIFELLADGPLPVGELAAQLPVTRPAVSQHLKVLREAGLVMDRQEGTRRFYQLDPQGIEEVRAYFDRFWSMALASFKVTVEQSGGRADDRTSNRGDRPQVSRRRRTAGGRVSDLH